MPSSNLGFLSVVSIGIGGMVGGGIFAVLGLAAELAGGGTPVAFLLAGLVALATAYSYARLSATYPSRGGSVEFVNRAFGRGLLAGGVGVLLWLSYIVMLALYASAFGSYGASFFSDGQQEVVSHLLTSAIVVLLTVLNAAGARAVGRVEEAIVFGKIAILVAFIALGASSVDTGRLALDAWSAPASLVAGGMIIFLAYEGFELIATTAEDVRAPEKTLPRAYYVAVVSVILLYVAVAAVTVGNLTPAEISEARDYALAEAARPFLGAGGFALIAVAALLSTSSAVNATLYGATRISFVMARDGELPPQFRGRVWRRPIEGLLITAGVTLIVANVFDISSIAAMGSSGFLLVFTAVNVANFRLARATGASRAFALAAATLCLGALGALLWEVARTSPADLGAVGGGVLAAFALEAVYRRRRARRSAA